MYPCLENPTDRGDRWSAVHGVAKSTTLCTTSNLPERQLAPEIQEGQVCASGPYCPLCPLDGALTAWVSKVPPPPLLPGPSFCELLASVETTCSADPHCGPKAQRKLRLREVK